jgi:hypothetical protein
VQQIGHHQCRAFWFEKSTAIATSSSTQRFPPQRHTSAGKGKDLLDRVGTGTEKVFDLF